MARQKIVAGNWKMNLDRAAATALTEGVAARRGEVPAVELVLCPPSLYLGTVGTALKLSGTASPSGVWLGGQNMHDKPSGAYTGEVAPAMLTDIGCHYVILGHSERRTLFGETDATVNAKTKAALAAGLVPIVCVGETLDQREAGQTIEVVAGQIEAVIAHLVAAGGAAVVAYEPVWAIGTGKVASPEDAQQVHAAIRGMLAEADSELAERTRIVYGGSVQPNNAEGLLSQDDIDGALVGGASLKAESFGKLIEIASKLAQQVKTD